MEENRALTLDDLPAGCRLLAEHIGLPLFLDIAEHFGGEMYYIPNLRQLRTRVRNRDIRTEYRSEQQPIPELSRKYRLSERQIRNIVRGRQKK